MRNIKLIVLDLDGTLLKSDKTVSVVTIDALEQARRAGIKIAFASARSEKAMLPYISAVKPDAVISNGGALAKAGGVEVFNCQLPAESVRHIIKRCFALSDGNCEITIESDHGYFWNYKPDTDLSYMGDNRAAVIYNDFRDFNYPAYKVTAEVEREQDARDIAAEIPDCETLSFRGEIWRRFARKAATKVNAIEHICGHFGVSRESAAAFGDDLNDLGMIEYCGMGVAMGNALPEVKAAARFVTGTNDEDGVARFIEREILCGKVLNLGVRDETIS